MHFPSLPSPRSTGRILGNKWHSQGREASLSTQCETEQPQRVLHNRMAIIRWNAGLARSSHPTPHHCHVGRAPLLSCFYGWDTCSSKRSHEAPEPTKCQLKNLNSGSVAAEHVLHTPHRRASWGAEGQEPKGKAERQMPPTNPRALLHLPAAPASSSKPPTSERSKDLKR